MIVNGFGGKPLIGFQDSNSWLTISSLSVNTTFVGSTWYSSSDSWAPSTEGFTTFVWPDITSFRVLRLRIISNTFKVASDLTFTSSISTIRQYIGLTTQQAKGAISSYKQGFVQYSASYKSSTRVVPANTDVWTDSGLSHSTSEYIVNPNYTSYYGFLEQYDCKFRPESFYFTKDSSYCLGCAFTTDFRYLCDGKTCTWQCSAVFEGLPY